MAFNLCSTLVVLVTMVSDVGKRFHILCEESGQEGLRRSLMEEDWHSLERSVSQLVADRLAIEETV